MYERGCWRWSYTIAKHSPISFPKFLSYRLPRGRGGVLINLRYLRSALKVVQDSYFGKPCVIIIFMPLTKITVSSQDLNHTHK